MHCKSFQDPKVDLFLWSFWLEFFRLLEKKKHSKFIYLQKKK